MPVPYTKIVVRTKDNEYHSGYNDPTTTAIYYKNKVHDWGHSKIVELNTKAGSVAILSATIESIEITN